jgi:Ca-activated chloride channel family protein
MHMQHAVLLAALLASPIHSQRADEFKLSTNAELVLLDVGVTDRSGTPVSNLSKEDFKVFDNGKIQAITHFASDDVPVTVGLVIDNSGSMRAKRAEVVTAGLAFIQQSNPVDEIFITHFNDHVTRSPFASDFNQLRSALLNGQPGGRTALYDAIVTSLDQLATGTKDKRTLLLVSDGGDNASKHTFEDVISCFGNSRS